ncbi:hypothetical protein CJ255_22300 [Candidatus Viridilinea mediisalina]|uniref:NAD-dependent epimerase/dehydratase domain-containing protein n=1 Tax=Candidatus Viridilinea mediisalina TaxID=2024553 RepID=A0A2A6RD70_9CHLR|nr:hypothetical protein CJ255_22300 [Candidatus Viridilinea mediisalina]
MSTGYRVNLAAVQDQIELLEGDLRDGDAVARAVAGVELVFHQGALPSVPRSVADPLTSHEVNSSGTLRLLLAARDAGVRRMVEALLSPAGFDRLSQRSEAIYSPPQP